MFTSWIAEPATTITDYALAALTLLWAWKLWRGSEGTTRRRWAGALIALGVAAALGGTVHGFRAALGVELERWLWWGALVAAGGFGYAALATAACYLPRVTSRVVSSAGLVAFVAYAAYVWGDPDFRYAGFASAAGLVVIAAVQSTAWLWRRAESAPWIVGGVAVSAIGFAIQRSGWGLAAGFNHNDVFHVVQIGGNYLLYRGGRLLDSRLPV